MSWIEPVTYETAPQAVKDYLDKNGHENLTRSRKIAWQLKNYIVYDAVEENAWRMDAEVQRLVGKRYGDLLEYTIASLSHSEICTEYYTKCLINQGINPDNPDYDEKDKVVIAFATAVVQNNGQIPENVRADLHKNFNEEQIAVLAGMAVACCGDILYERIFDLK